MQPDTCAVCLSPLSDEPAIEDVVIDMGLIGKKTIEAIDGRSCTMPECTNRELRIQAFSDLLSVVSQNLMAKRFALRDGRWKVA